MNDEIRQTILRHDPNKTLVPVFNRADRNTLVYDVVEHTIICAPELDTVFLQAASKVPGVKIVYDPGVTSENYKQRETHESWMKLHMAARRLANEI